ncbi:hypothetical protein [Trichormus sp. NMC-1]|nr:hypothetical protein [Trichormus sp. NMC-1]
MATTEIKFTLTLPEVPEIHRLEAEKKSQRSIHHDIITSWRY